MHELLKFVLEERKIARLSACKRWLMKMKMMWNATAISSLRRLCIKNLRALT